MPSTSAFMTHAARALLASLTPAQRVSAGFPFADDERFHWHFTPIPRRGLPFRDMLPHQQKLAHALVSTGYSVEGGMKAAQVMSLEQVLHEYEEGAMRRFVRDPDLYFISVFGEPSNSSTWGWRLEGHHISLNVTLKDGQAFTAAPTFFGANPAEVKLGPRTGLRVLAAEEDLARSLLESLDADQRRHALYDDAAPDDILSYNHHRATDLGTAGISAAKLTPSQREHLMAILEVYAGAMPPEIASTRLTAATSAPADQLRFAWAGAARRGERHYYRIQSPSFLVEYDNTQNGANHIHSVWRDFTGDWGFDLLGQHLVEAHAR